MPSTEIKHIEETPGTCGGKPQIAGTGIRVQDIVIWTEQGQSADEIVTDYPHLSLAGVYAALAYYHDHRERIEADMRRADELMERMMADPALCQTQTPAVNAKSLEGLRHSFGAWAEDSGELDAYLEWNRQQRKQSRPEIEP